MSQTVWRHISQTVRGASHAVQDAACQDSCLIRVLGEGSNEELVACVADGAGSAEHSGIGSELACRSIVASATAYFGLLGSLAELDAETVLDWCERARQTIYEHAEENSRHLREYASTLCAAVITPRKSIFLQIGDGAIVVKQNGILGVVFWPQSGEYINTTNFITSQEYREQVQVFETSNSFSDVALLTDGIERLALRFDVLTAHQPFFQPFFDALRRAADVASLSDDLGQFLQSASVQSKSDDDKTLVLASRIVESERDVDGDD